MGIDYCQSCMIGVVFTEEELKKVISKQEFEMQPRYDPKTGKQVSVEKVIIKDEQCIYSLMGEEREDLYLLAEDLADKFDLDCQPDYDEESICLGMFLGESCSYGRVDLLCGDYKIEELQKMKKSLAKKLPEYEGRIKIIFIPSVS